MLQRIISAALAAVCCLTFTAFTPLPIQEATAVLRKDMPESMTVPEDTRRIDGTKADWERFQSLIKSISLDSLKSFDILYWNSSKVTSIPREESLRLLEKLKTLECTVKQTTTTEEENLSTVNRWGCVFQTADTAFSISYNGSTLSVTVPAEKTTYEFLSLGKTSLAIRMIIQEIWAVYEIPSYYNKNMVNPPYSQ